MTPSTPDRTAKEKKLYGPSWNEVYGGYFSDPAVAGPLVDAIVLAADEYLPSVMTDLGGGTGFVLSQVAARYSRKEAIKFVCVDTAPEQLEDCPWPLIRLQCPLEELRRDMLVEGRLGLLLCMRSVLHYFGRDGLAADTARLRALLKPGEYLVHQTVCFEDERDQEIANTVYERIGTSKWYPTHRELSGAMKQAGFAVEKTETAPSLPITDSELALRYEVDADRMKNIGRELAERCRGRHTVYMPREDGFTIHLDYLIMTCRAK